MPTCDKCGEEIEFRYLDGRPTPIHVYGGWCSGTTTAKGRQDSRPFRTAEAYTVPNAFCPVCGAQVFFYANASGSRVFFDDLGWPWPKHGCTDNTLSQKGKIRRIGRASKRATRVFSRALMLYELANIRTAEKAYFLKFRNLRSPLTVWTLSIPTVDLDAQGWTVQDFREAPSFIMRKRETETVVEFISVRRCCVGQVVFPSNRR